MIKQINFDAPPIIKREVFRYAGCKSETDDVDPLINICCDEIKGRLSYRVCFDICDLLRDGDFLAFANVNTNSNSLRKAFKGCDSVLVFGATVGAQMDRLILKYSMIEPSKALIMQALGAERIESLCNTFCQDIAQKLSNEGKSLLPRVSPGYGDIPLTMQGKLFEFLDCPRKIGLTLNAQNIMSPSKSVTAIAGIKNCK